MKKKDIILGVSASIAIYKACDLVRRLQDEGFAVTVVMTPEAEEFIRPVLFAELSGSKVYGALFKDREAWDIEHVSLAKKASLLLIAPATANIIAKISAGICDELLGCLSLATHAPVLICPAMNENMYRHKITQANIARLKSLGYRFIGPRKGRLACGEFGTGCMAEIEDIVKEVKKAL
ncbi:MAG: flavoprotein [Candidatus Omnitrophota bacterium]